MSDDFKKRSGIACKKIWGCGGSAGGHSICLPGSKPHNLFPDIEAAITKFVKQYSGS